jgi:hypothetical protein
MIALKCIEKRSHGKKGRRNKTPNPSDGCSSLNAEKAKERVSLDQSQIVPKDSSRRTSEIDIFTPIGIRTTLLLGKVRRSETRAGASSERGKQSGSHLKILSF